MKKKSLILCSLLLTTSINASIFDTIKGGASSVGNTVSGWYGTAQDFTGGMINSKNSKIILDKINKGSWSFDDLKEVASSGGLKGIFDSEAYKVLEGHGKGANQMIEYCYEFSPPSMKNPTSVINPCDMGDAVKVCDNAPDLSHLGYKKKSSEDLRKYCEALGKAPDNKTGGTLPSVGGGDKKEPITENIKNSSVIDKLKDKYEKLRKSKSSASGGGSGTSKSSPVNDKKISGSSIDVKENKNNQEVQKVYYQNNYKAYTLLEDAHEVSNDKKEIVDLSKASNGFKTLDEYKEATKVLTQIFYINENGINLSFLKNNVDMLFKQINYQTADIGEQESLKTSEGASLLKAFSDQLEIWRVSEIEKRLVLLTNEAEQIVNPSEEMLDSTNDTNTRIAMVYYGKKNQTEKAKIVSDVEIEAFDYLEKAKSIIELAKAKSRTFDRAGEYNNILNSLSSIK